MTHVSNHKPCCPVMFFPLRKSPYSSPHCFDHIVTHYLVRSVIKQPHFRLWTQLPGSQQAQREKKKQSETKTHYPNFSFAGRASRDGFIDHQQSSTCFSPDTFHFFFACVLMNVAVLSSPEMKIGVKKKKERAPKAHEWPFISFKSYL